MHQVNEDNRGGEDVKVSWRLQMGLEDGAGTLDDFKNIKDGGKGLRMEVRTY